MLKLIKQWLCRHSDIITQTEASLDSLLIVKTLIKCRKCDKSFPQHPHAQCCYVMHIHSQILQEKFIHQLKSAKQ
jgi:hypothetical protein